MITTEERKLYDIMDELGINYTRYEHEAAFTIEEANQLNIPLSGQLCKNLFLRNYKGNMHYLVILDQIKNADLKLIAEQIGSSKLSFASEERMGKYLGLKPGSVSPFGLINDKMKEVIVLVDRDLSSSENISFHPNINTATLNLSYNDFMRFLDWCGNEFHYIDIN